MYTVIEGGVTAAAGFETASTVAGIKYKNRKDMAMIYSEKPCRAAGTFTTNIVKAAPVKWDQKIVKGSELPHRLLSSTPALQMHVPALRVWATAQRPHRRLPRH